MNQRKAKNYKTATITIKIEPEIKFNLEETAERKCMDMSKLARAILTNWVKPDTYIL